MAVLSAVMLAAELTLTRLLSVVLWYHFAFFAISVALFGLSAAALVVHFVGARLRAERVGHWLAFGALGVALGLVLVDLAFCNVTPDWFEGGFTALTGKLIGLFLLAALPFFAGGFSVSLALTTYAREAPRLYAWDLFGAALGALLTILLLDLMGAPRGLAALAGVAALSGVGFLMPGREAATSAAARPRAAFTQLACLVIGAASVGLGAHGGRPLTLEVAKGIDLAQSPPEFMKWNAFSLVTVLPYTGFKGWGLAPRYEGSIAEQKTLVIDMNAMTPLVRFEGEFKDVAFVTHDLSAFVYRVRPESGRALVIGAGGGKDVLAALASGSPHVTAVEVNPIIVQDVMRGSFKDYVGDLYGRPDVTAVVEDGRSFARRTPERYGVVHLSMVDTSAASAAGAYALTENALYTKEAFSDFLAALEPNGILSVSSVSLPDLWVGPRLVAIARAALAERASAVPLERQLMVLETPWLGVNEARMYNVLIAPEGFEAAAVERAIEHAGALGFSIAWAPGDRAVAGTPERALIQHIIKEPDDGALARELAALPLDVSATTDDRPFFFYQNRLAHLPLALFAKTPGHLFGNGLVLLAKIVMAALVCVLVLLALPLLFGGRDRRQAHGSAALDLGFAGCLGFGFMFVELGLLHRLSPHLGDPTAALGVVLVAILLGCALGSRALAGRGEVAVKRALLGLVVVACVAAWALPILTSHTRGLAPLPRSFAVGALVFVVGVLLGVPLPAALSRISRRAPSRVAWFWAVNGGTSVLATIVATLLALHLGATVTVLTGAAVYALAWGLGRWVLRGDASVV